MAALKIILAVLALGTHAQTAEISSRDDDVILNLRPDPTGGYHLELVEGDEEIVLGHIGRTIVGVGAHYENVENGVEIDISGVNLTISTLYDSSVNARGIKIKWNAGPQKRLEDCINYGQSHWYAGPMQQEQIYPIETAPRTYGPYISTEENNGAIVERYWLNSDGQYIYVHPQVPLFVDYNNLLTNHICFGAQVTEPYSIRRNHTELSYDIWMLPDVKSAHQHAVNNYLGKPTDLPDYRMVQHPIWSTWAQFSKDINETNVIQFANEIRSYGFNDSQFEIDDLWEECYGSLKIDESKFSNFSGLVEQLKSMDFRVTLWIHPFINKGCDPWYTEALENGYFVQSESGSADGTWWNNNGTESGYIDFTNPEAAEWWYDRVKNLSDTYQIDSFKFDAGEANYAPQVSVQNGDIDLQPHHIVEAYVRTCARFGNMIEVRAGFRTQDLPIFVRMVDRDSIWGLNNGLSTIITTSLQMSLNGYAFVLPDMIGGNGFNLNHEQADIPTKELFIRWIQANAFLPAMQYSYVPWNFDTNETVVIAKKYTDLHASYADKIYAAMKNSVDDGSPVVAPLWWIAPMDEETYTIWDQFLVGEDILVAPVLIEGSTSRDIYLPAGAWLEEGDPDRPQQGPVWLTDYGAPLDTLPFFIRETVAEDAVTLPTISMFLIALGILINLFNLF